MTRLALPLVALLLGALNAWIARHAMNPDGVAYLDIADAYRRGEWGAAINAYWSPLYSWLLAAALLVLRPSPYWEFAVVHLVNVLCYAGALAAFHYLLTGLIGTARDTDDGAGFDETSWLLIGYAVFLWATIGLISMWVVTPDLCVAALTFLGAGLVVRVPAGAAGHRAFAALGLVLGVGYLAKSSYFGLAFVFLAVAAIACGDAARAVTRLLVGLATFALVVAPFVAVISRATGRLTFSEAPALNYAWFALGVPPYRHWRGEPPGTGTPLHPPLKLSSAPDVYEFNGPVGGTYPLWRDPAYWHAGLRVHADPMMSLRLAVRAVRDPAVRQALQEHATFVAVLLALVLGGGRGRASLAALRARWLLLLPAGFAITAHAAVLVLTRYIAPFSAVLMLMLVSAVRVAPSAVSGRLLRGAALALVVVTALPVVQGTLDARTAARHARSARSAHAHWEVATGLAARGVVPGERVAVVGETFGAYWARLARVTIVAEMPQESLGDLAPQGGPVNERVIQVLGGTGAKAIVTDRPFRHTAGWTRLGETEYYVHLLR